MYVICREMPQQNLPLLDGGCCLPGGPFLWCVGKMWRRSGCWSWSKKKKNNNKSFGKTAQIKKRSLPAGKPLKGWLCGGALQCVQLCVCMQSWHCLMVCTSKAQCRGCQGNRAAWVSLCRCCSCVRLLEPPTNEEGRGRGQGKLLKNTSNCKKQGK